MARCQTNYQCDVVARRLGFTAFFRQSRIFRTQPVHLLPLGLVPISSCACPRRSRRCSPSSSSPTSRAMKLAPAWPRCRVRSKVARYKYVSWTTPRATGRVKSCGAIFLTHSMWRRARTSATCARSAYLCCFSIPTRSAMPKHSRIVSAG